VAGYLIAVIAFTIPFAFGATGIGRPRIVIGLGVGLASIWAVALVTGRAQDGQGNHLVPVWFLAGLVALLYGLWCGGLWLGLRLRKVRAR
jgi:type VI protein secretion system component VasK